MTPSEITNRFCADALLLAKKIRKFVATWKPIAGTMSADDLTAEEIAKAEAAQQELSDAVAELERD